MPLGVANSEVGSMLSFGSHPQAHGNAPFSPEPKGGPAAPFSPDHKGVAPFSPDHKGVAPFSPDHKGVSPFAPDHKGSAPFSPDHKGAAPFAPDHKGGRYCDVYTVLANCHRTTGQCGSNEIEVYVDSYGRGGSCCPINRN